MNNTIGLKIIPVCVSAKCIGIVRKHCSLSIADIKKAITEEQYVLSCDYIDEEGIADILQCYRTLYDAGITAQLFEHDRSTTIEFIHNLLQWHKEITKQIDDEMEAESN